MMQLLNTHTAILNIRIFSRRYPITSDYGFLLRLVNTFTIDTDEYYLMCYKVNDTKTFKNLVGLTRNYFRLLQGITLGFDLLCLRYKSITYVYCRLARLTGWGL